jgi:hypothetical protein
MIERNEMMSTIHLDGQITASGELLLELPKDLPSGRVHVTIEVSSPETLEAEDFSEEEVENLLIFTPKTGTEIVAAGLTGAWQDMDITDPVAWVERQRRKQRDASRW